MRLVVVFLAAACLMLAQTAKPTSYAEATGDGAAHQLASSGSCRTVQIITPTANGTVVRIGDSTIGSTKGLPITPGSGLFLPPLTSGSRLGPDQIYYDLSALYYFAASGDKVDFVCFK